MTKVITHSPDETIQFAVDFSIKLTGGNIVFLIGELGVGKTVFAKGIAHGLGVKEPVTSPSFGLFKSYQGKLTLNHYDFYRLELEDDLTELGLENLYADDAVTIIEWGESFHFKAMIPQWEVRLSYTGAVDVREIEIRRVER